MRRRACARLATALTVLLLGGCTASSTPAARSTAAAAPSASRSAGASGAPRPTAAPPTAASSTASGSAAASAARAVPRFAHLVVVVEENHAKGEVLGSSSAPYFNALARSGTVLTNAYGIRHPSYPNYLALFSGSTHGITNDSCPHSFRGNNLGAQLRSKHLSFVGYAQSLPRTGWRGCTYGGVYARRHAPWNDFGNLPRSVSKPMSAFPHDFSRLPRVSFVIPNLRYDMHDGTVRQADTWLRRNLGSYVKWARTHDSALIVTWDEDDKSAGNHIPGLIVGDHVKRGHFGGRVDHYRMLRTIEAAYGLTPLGRAAHRSPITGIWN